MRRHDREVTDRARLEAIIADCDCLRIGLSAPEGAYIVPLSFGYEAGEPARFYVHSAKQGRKVSMIGAGARVGFELDCAHRLGEGESACKHTYFFRSIIGTGMLCPIDDGEEKKRALACIMAHYRKDRAFSFTDEAAASVQVYCLAVDEMCGKEHL